MIVTLSEIQGDLKKCGIEVNAIKVSEYFVYAGSFFEQVVLA